MATIKRKECPIKENTFYYMGKCYNCKYAITRDKEMILQEAETSHKDTFDTFYKRDTLRADRIRLFIDEDGTPIYAMIIYIIDYKNENTGRYACGGYYPFEVDNLLTPHPYQESICW